MALFLATAPALLRVRWRHPHRMPWWLVIALSGGLGWLWITLSTHYYFEHLSTLIVEYPSVSEAPSELVKRWQSDGAPRVFALLFGWLYEWVYLSFCLIPYALLSTLRRRRARSRRLIDPVATPSKRT
jgi:hypothetical protein